MSGDKTENSNQTQAVRNTLGLLPMIALSAALTAPAQAQEASVVLDEISVQGNRTGTGAGYKSDRVQSKKSTAPLLETPQTVTVVPEQVIEDRGAADLTEVLRNTPGISFDAGENAFSAGGDQIYIRGMNAAGSMFVDGARDNGNYMRDTFNTEQVEVVKGVGSANGRGGGAGYVNMATKTPKLDDFIRGSARVGFDDSGRVRTRGTVDFNKAIDNFAFRLNGMAEGGKLFGRDMANSDAWGLAPSLAYGLGTDFRAILAYEHLERKGLPDSGVPINRAGTTANPNGAPWGVAIRGAGDRPYQGNRPVDTFFGDPNGYDKTKHDSFLARFEYDATDWLTISNQTRWSKLDRDADFRLAGSGATATGSIQNRLNRVNETWTNQTNLTAEFETGSLSHTLSAGVEFTRETANAIRGGNANNLSTVKVDTIAAYAYDNIKFNEQWSLNGGLRVERFSTKITDSQNQIPNAGGSYSHSNTLVDGQIGVVFKPVQEASLYASYGLTHQPYGSLLSNPDISRTGANAFPGFIAGAKPTASHNYEIGAKWDLFGGDLSLTGALFRTEKHNVAYVGKGTDPSIVYGQQIVQGIELGFSGNITSAWSVFGGVTILDSKRRHGAEVDRALISDYTANGTYFPAVTTTNGDALAYTPKFTANLWTTYRMDNGLTLGGGFQYVGESWIGRPDDATRVIPNGKWGKLPGYFLVNLMAAYEFNDNITLRFNVDNVFNETYLTTANWNASWGYVGAPRTYRFGTSFKF